MAKIIWDEIGKRFYETGVKNGVLYVQDQAGAYPLGVAWNGLTAVSENPSGAEPTPLYADDIKYITLMSVEEFGATIEAFTYPDEFGVCDGSAELANGLMIGQQARKPFGLAYRTVLGNDVDGEDHGYKLHLIYGALAAPSEKAYQTINDSPEAITFSWEVTTTPVAITGYKPTASVVIDSTKADEAKLAILEGILFGAPGVDPRLPKPDEIKTLLDSPAPAALALSSIVPDDEADSVAVDANIVLTFNNKVANEAIVVASEDGDVIAGVKTWDTAGKVLTFNPTDNFDSATLYIVTVGGVTDIYGQALAAEVKNFTTA